MSPVVSTEDGKTAQVDNSVDVLLILGNLWSLACRNKSILYEIPTVTRGQTYIMIDIGCHYDKNA